MMAIIVKKIFLGWPLLFALLLPSCGQLCIMGQGKCPAFKVETKLTITPSATNHTIQNAFTSVNFTLAGGAPNYTIVVTYQIDKLVTFTENPQPNNFLEQKSITKSDHTSNSFTLFFNTTGQITADLTASNNKVTVKVTDKNNKTTEATITVSKPST